jgi:hypothetical protein
MITTWFRTRKPRRQRWRETAGFNNRPVGEGGEDGLGERARSLIEQVKDKAEGNRADRD